MYDCVHSTFQSKFCTNVKHQIFIFIMFPQGAHKSRSHSFPSMKSDQRKFVHELAEAFGCATQSYDEEPNRNVVATAVK